MSFCTLCGTTSPADLGETIGICLNAENCHRRQAERREFKAWVAEMIAREIEDSMCEPGPNCTNRRCRDCIRWRQAQEDAATARRIGGATATTATTREV